MKRNISITTAVLAVLVLLAACKPPFEPDFDVDFSRQAQNIEERLFTVAVDGTPNWTRQPATGGVPQKLTLRTTTKWANPDHSGSVITDDFNLTFTAGGKIPGVEVYILGDGTAATATSSGTTHTRGAALAYTAVVSAKNKVELTFPLTEVVKNQVLLVVDPAEAAFSDAVKGKGKLDTDGDNVPGEAEDVFVEYITVSANTTVTPNLDVTPNLLGLNIVGISSSSVVSGYATPNLSVTDTITNVGGTKVQFTIANAANDAWSLDKNSIEGAFKFQRFRWSDHTWEDYSPISKSWGTVPGTEGQLTFNFPAAQLYDFFRYQVDPYKVAETAASHLGYTHRGSYDQSIGFGASRTISSAADAVDGKSGNHWRTGDWYYATTSGNTNVANNVGPTPAAIPAFGSQGSYKIQLGGVRGSYYIDVEVPTFGGISGSNAGSTVLVADSLKISNGNIQVYYYEGNTIAKNEKYSKLDIEDSAIIANVPPITTGVTEARTFRIQMPADFVPVSVSGSGRVEVRLNDVRVKYTTGTTPNINTVENVKIFDASKEDGYLRVQTTNNFTN